MLDILPRPFPNGHIREKSSKGDQLLPSEAKGIDLFLLLAARVDDSVQQSVAHGAWLFTFHITQ